MESYMEDSYTYEYYRKPSTEELLVAMWDGEELAFTHLPKWLQQYVEVYGLNSPRRSATLIEQKQSEEDWKLYRIVNRELTLEDIKRKYLHGEQYNV
jgi:hypothetical protein